MKDEKRLYDDYRKFNMRFQRYCKCIYRKCLEKKGQALTFEKTIKLTDDDKFVNIINYRHYNKIAKSRIK